MIHLGFEVGTGQPVAIPPKNLCISGQTQESGKTTALEAIVTRSGRRALAFVTKRGERCFAGGRRIQPYFRDHVDWQFVEAVIESTMRQRMKFERAWIMRATKGVHTLAGVRDRLKTLQSGAKRSMDQDIYMCLGEYLDLVVPLLAKVPLAPSLDLRDGLNVMDLGPYPTELQALLIRSALEWIYEKEEGVLTVIPEAWEHIPESRGSPVTLAAVALVRKGSALRNIVALDSQDIAGVRKEILKQVPVWLLGVQREANELKRALAHMPAGLKKPKLAEVATLGLGQFWVCYGEHCRKVYVQPAWMSEAVAKDVAMGRSQPEAHRPKTPEVVVPASPAPAPSSAQSLDPRVDRVLQAFTQSIQQALCGPMAPASEALRGNGVMPLPAPPFDGAAEDALYQRFKERLAQEAPALLRVLVSQPELEVAYERPTLQCDGSSLRGRLARMINEGWFDEPKKGQAAFDELKRRGATIAKPSVYNELKHLAGLGFVTVEGTDGFKAVAGIKSSIRVKG